MRAAASYALALAIFAGCSKPSAEQQIGARIDAALKAANAQAPGPIIDTMTEDFTGPGGLGRRETARVIYGLLLRGGRSPPGWVRVIERARDITVDPSGEQAEAAVELLMARGAPVHSPKDLLPTNADALRFKLRWARVDGRWQVRAASYTRLRP